MRPNARQIDKSVDRTQQVVIWNMPLERKLVKQRRLINPSSRISHREVH
jgi:hypothetical protein